MTRFKRLKTQFADQSHPWKSFQVCSGRIESDRVGSGLVRSVRLGLLDITVSQYHSISPKLTCLMPYLISKSRKLYSLACAGRGMAVAVMDAPVDGGPLTVRPPTDAWYASMLARLAITGSAANANVSLQSSTECTTLSMSLGCRSISRQCTLFFSISVTVSLRRGLCSLSASFFSNTNIDTSCNGPKTTF